jgi:hypothetical protein
VNKWVIKKKKKWIKWLQTPQSGLWNPKSCSQFLRILGGHLVSLGIRCVYILLTISSPLHCIDFVIIAPSVYMVVTEKLFTQLWVWEFGLLSWKAVHRAFYCHRLPNSQFLFHFLFSYSPSPSFKVLSTQKAVHSSFLCVLIANMHIQTHLSFQNN